MPTFTTKLRRWSLPALSLGMALLLAGSAAAQTEPLVPPQPQAVARGVWIIGEGIRPNRQPDGNTVMFAASPHDLVVMDTGRHAWRRRAILDFAAGHQSRIIAIVNSHWHLDHVSGNPELKRAFPGARVYASLAIDEALTGFLARSVRDSQAYLTPGKLPAELQEDIRNDNASIANGEALKPDVPIDVSRAVRFRRLTLRVNLARNAATAGDVWVYDAASRVVAVGDLVTLPAPFLDTACPEGWSRALDEIWATPFTLLAPGHGPVMNRAQFALYRSAFNALIDCAKSTAPAAGCAAAWVHAVEPLLGPDPLDARRAQGMTQDYVEGLLRANGGRRTFCSTGASFAHPGSGR